MKYDFRKIADRILDERHKTFVSRGKSNQYNRDEQGHIIYAHKYIEGYRPATQKDIINIARDLGLHIGRNSLSDIENGMKDISALSLEELTALSTIYDCETAYLLCEQPLPYRKTIDGMQATHLSSEAVNVLANTTNEDRDTLDLLSFIIANDNGIYLSGIMYAFGKFLDNACEYSGVNDRNTLWEEDRKAIDNVYRAFIDLRDDYFRTHPMKSAEQKLMEQLGIDT